MAELYKLIYNKFFYFCSTLIIIIMVICNFNFDAGDRLEHQVYYFSFIFLIITSLIVGSVISNEYFTTLKEVVMAVNNRGLVYFSKLVAVITGISALYLIYVIGLLLTNHQVDKIMIFNQYFAIVIHTLLVICIAYILKSFSSLLIVSVVLLCIYRELSKIKITEFWNYILSTTYYELFNNLSFSKHLLLVGCIVSAIYTIIGYKLFCVQDIS